MQGSSGTTIGQQSQGFVDDGNIETHITVIAVINLIFSIPVAGVGLLLFFGSLVGAGFAEAFSDVPGLGALIVGAGAVIGLLFIAASLPGLLSGVGLLKRASWGKIWTIVAGALSLVNVPIGTLFGAYAIYVMTRPETDAALGSGR